MIRLALAATGWSNAERAHDQLDDCAAKLIAHPEARVVPTVLSSFASELARDAVITAVG
jgi:hypothetical protein